MFMKRVLACVLVLTSVVAMAQNLVKDPGFEMRTSCPASYNQQRLNQLQYWDQPTKGTPDYFHSCSAKMAGDRNMFGGQMPFDGDAFAGVVAFSPSQRNYREYLQTRLTRPLKQGEWICATVRVSPADLNRFYVGGLGMYFSAEPWKDDKSLVKQATPQVMNPMLHVLDNSEEWVEISDAFEAHGGEEYLSIGNFLSDREMRVLRKNKILAEGAVNEWSYFFVDGVSVIAVSGPEACACSVRQSLMVVRDPPMQLDESKSLEFRNVLFAFDKDELTAEAQKELNEVARVMKKQKSFVVQVNGHADIVGRQEYNIDLSRKRAEAVISFLQAKGISSDRLSIRFFGSEKPAAENDTPEGRALNRRVEFEIRERKYELFQ
jgi:outer membrane protein OmpA-like peptidoglycan-associated protein